LVMERKRWLTTVLGGLLVMFVWLALSSVSVSATPPTQNEEPVEHVVQAGETLYGIAQRYNTTVNAIVGANDIVDPSRIAAGQILVIPGADGTSSAKPSESLTSYLTVPGDTLDAVARRFETTPADVAQLNGIVSPTGLPAGGLLRVPGQYTGRLHRVMEGETALRLALRYDLPLWEFLSVNELSSPGALLPGQRVWVPNQTVTSTMPLPFVALDVAPFPVLQGYTVRVKADLVPGAEVRGVFADEVLNFAVEEDTHYALFGVHAQANPGRYTLALLATDAAGDEAYVTQSIEVVDADFEFAEISLSVDLLDNAALAAERARIAEIRPVYNPERYWDGLFTRPITTEITSGFGITRLYKYPSTEFYGYHEGTDFNGAVGSPVYAPAAGRAVLAEPLYLRGNAVVIDHGWGVYTGYWHLSEINVEAGQFVEPGDLIGLVGSTGRSTGAHLHWDFWVNGTNVNALQWTEQPFP
jgi:murein DD-endopeptidase MepM/ murein hydrolase activator NlpD